MSFAHAVIPRINTFDILRGYFLVVILLNHLHYFPSGLDILTGRGILYVSSAEGFFLISGIVLGIVRGRKLVEKPLKVASKLLLKRSFQLYAAYVVLTLLFTFIAWAVAGNPGIKPTPAPSDLPLAELIWQTLTFQYLYGWADFLRLYIIFLLATPLAFWLLRKKLWYVVLAASAAVWALFPFTSQDYWAMPVSWQLVFFIGIVIGFYWPELTARWQKLPGNTGTVIGSTLFITAILTALVSMYLIFSVGAGTATDAMIDLHRTIEQYFNKDRLPVAHLMLGAVWFWGLFWLVRRYESWFQAKIGWLLLPMGANSLYVYILQSFLVFFFHLYILLPQYTHQAFAPWYVNLLLSLLSIALIWIAVKRKFLFTIIPR